MARKLKPVHPGEILQRGVHGALGAEHEQNRHGSACPGNTHRGYHQRAPRHHCGYRAPLCALFRKQPGVWMNLQTRYDLEVAEDEIARKVERDVQPLAENRQLKATG